MGTVLNNTKSPLPQYEMTLTLTVTNWSRLQNWIWISVLALSDARIRFPLCLKSKIWDLELLRCWTLEVFYILVVFKTCFFFSCCWWWLFHRQEYGMLKAAWEIQEWINRLPRICMQILCCASQFSCLLFDRTWLGFGALWCHTSCCL